LVGIFGKIRYEVIQDLLARSTKWWSGISGEIHYGVLDGIFGKIHYVVIQDL
jgi:hypothetical protein